MTYYITFSVKTTRYPSDFDREEMISTIAGLMEVDDDAVDIADEEMEDSE